MEFSRVLKEQRIEHDLSQEQLADKLHIARQSISKWERGEAYPGIGTLLRLSELFDVSVDALLKGDESLKEEIVKDGERVNHPKLKLFFDWMFLTGAALLLVRVCAAVLTEFDIIEWDAWLLRGWLPSLVTIALMLIGGIGSDELRKNIKR